MTPYHSDPWLTVYQGDCREVMAQMEPESIHCVVTSPPYWGLRDYGTATWLGGDDGCDHRPDKKLGRKFTNGQGLANSTSNTSWADRDESAPFGSACPKCGAVRQDSQLGLEPTPEEYVANMVAVFREVRRVLRRDGTCWVNLGDSYANDTKWGGSSGGKHVAALHGDTGIGRGKRDTGLKAKDLVGIPWRVAFALQADGWYLRSDIIWSKPNPMPESVTDRPTKAHEYLFLLTKSPRYYYDSEAVREDAIHAGRIVKASDPLTAKNGQKGEYGATALGFTQHDTVVGAGRNLRTVWTIATQPYPGAHFATFPEALVEPCVKAGTSERGVCPECGAPWVREVESELVLHQRILNVNPDAPLGALGNAGDNRARDGHIPGHREVTTTGWRPSCRHKDNGQPDPLVRLNGEVVLSSVPATVLDPFAGSGTTGRVAQRLSRRAVLIDLSGEYLTQTMKRNADIPLGLETA